MSPPPTRASHPCPCALHRRNPLGGSKTYIPGINVVANYERPWLPKDVVAGLVLSALLVPQVWRTPNWAGLPPVTGLSTSILCLVGYAVLA